MSNLPWLVVGVDGTISEVRSDKQANEFFNEVVEGWFETARLPGLRGVEEIVVIVNEEGLLKPLKMNRRFRGLCGNAVVCTMGMTEPDEDGISEPDLVPFDPRKTQYVKALIERFYPIMTEEEAEAGRPELRYTITQF